MILRPFIEQQCAAYRSLGHFDLLGEFLLLNNCQEVRGSPLPKGVKPGKQKYCYSNAGMLVLKDKTGDYNYMEGYAIRESLGLPIHHAWIECRGQVIDNTWKNPDETCWYLGYKFTKQQLMDRTNATRYWGLFDTGMGMDFDFMFELDPRIESVLPDHYRVRRCG